MQALIKAAAVGTRIMCIIIGSVTTLLFALLALGAATFPQGKPFIPAWEITSSIIGVGILLASGYIMFAIGWQARFFDVRYRAINFILLLLPLSLALVLVMPNKLISVPSSAAVILALFTAWLLLLCTKPGTINEVEHADNAP